ncbi:MAG: indole-3-glycerol-phosphate synthase [Leptospiraceae bacterium]|nr:indole-3-glycerol-phosphate synthase [Leptospiraceae bacterium]
MSVLHEIIEQRKKDVATLKKELSGNPEKNLTDFAAVLRREPEAKLNLIAEIKRKSPSQGDLKPVLKVEEAVNFYEPYASALSVLTEPHYFNGSIEDLSTASRLTDKPLLRKDFIIDALQIREARFHGASAYLLIAAALSKSQLAELLHAGQEWNMQALVEVHNERELETAMQVNAAIIGVNNRDLGTLSIDIATALRVFSQLSQEERNRLIMVAESGYKTKEDLATLPDYIDAVLMGTAFMEVASPANKLQELFGT